nr:MAG TPA: hypothetical protein [Bacteriophage sp.]
MKIQNRKLFFLPLTLYIKNIYTPYLYLIFL